MTKNIIISFGLFISLALGSAAWAGTVTIKDSNAGGGDLVFQSSPSTLMSEVTSGSAFTIVSASSKTTKANGIEYCLISGNGNIYQMKQAGDGAVTTAGTTAGALAATGFAVKGS